MDKLKKLLGIPLVCIGVAVLAASYFIRLHSNALLLTGFAFVVAGVVGYVWKNKV